MPAIIRTVLGDIDPAQLGLTLAHEHVSQDHFPIWGDADLTLKDEDLVARELTLAKDVGVRSVGELSTPDTNQDRDALARVSKACGVQIIGSTGWFYGKHLPPVVREGQVSELVDIMERDVLDGTVDGGVRAGVIGEIGWSENEMLDGERKVFEAAAIVHQRTGVPLYTHTTEGTLGPQQIEFFSKLGVDPSRIAVSHMDTNTSYDYQLEVARQGAYLSYDRIGSDRHLTDVQRVEFVVRLVDQGYAKQLLLGQDTARLTQLAERGGRGYGYLVTTFLPLLRAAGVDDETIRVIVEENPRRYYAFSPPR